MGNFGEPGEFPDHSRDELRDTFTEQIAEHYQNFFVYFLLINTMTFGLFGMILFGILIDYNLIQPSSMIIVVSMNSGIFCFLILLLRYREYFYRYLIKKIFVDTRFKTHLLSVVGQSVFLIAIVTVILISLYVFIVGSSISLGLEIQHDLSFLPPVVVITFFVIGISFVTLTVQEILKFIDHKLAIEEANQSRFIDFVEKNIESLTERINSPFNQLYQSIRDQEE